MRTSIAASAVFAAAWFCGAFALPPTASAADEVTIYRCTDGKGRLSLRDSPCSMGDRQETRNMLRPKDAPPRTQPPLPVPAVATPAPAPQIIVVNTPRPLYECVAPDNTRYLSDTPEGQARWVPLWPQAYPIQHQVSMYTPGHLNVRVDNGRLNGSYQSGGTLVAHAYAGMGSGTWVRDPCNTLPQIEVCEHLRDRRDALRRRFFNAQPSERATLSREERSIDARLDQDCR
jgi:hypothetical protein